MSWQDLAWRGSVKVRDPEQVGNGFVSSVGVVVGGGATLGSAIAQGSATKPRARSALDGGGAGGASVTVEPMSPPGSPGRPPGRLK